jgi:hypothetical protein
VPLILQVGNTSSIEAEEEMLDSLDDIDIGDIDDETIGIDDIFDL